MKMKNVKKGQFVKVKKWEQAKKHLTLDDKLGLLDENGKTWYKSDFENDNVYRVLGVGTFSGECVLRGYHTLIPPQLITKATDEERAAQELSFRDEARAELEDILVEFESGSGNLQNFADFRGVTCGEALEILLNLIY